MQRRRLTLLIACLLVGVGSAAVPALAAHRHHRKHSTCDPQRQINLASGPRRHHGRVRAHRVCRPKGNPAARGPAPQLGGGYPNARIAEIGLSRLGQHGGECKEAVNQWVAIASGGSQHLGGDYLQNYRVEGGVEVARDQAVEGDIIQLNGSDGRYYYEGMHTAVVVAHTPGSGTFTVVDSNWEWKKTVREHSWNPYVTAAAHGLTVHIWRMGDATSPPGTTGEMPVIPASATAPEGTRFTEQGSGNQYLSVLGAALPISYGDAQALDAEGNTALALVAAGYLAAHRSTLPAGTRIRPDGQLNQYIYDGEALHYVDTTVAGCLDRDNVRLHTVPTAWSGKYPVSPNPSPCGLPDETRFVEQGSLTQYLSVLGAALPISYADAQALDADGNTAIATVNSGFVSGVPKTLPAGTWIRPDGQLHQYVFNGSSLDYVDTSVSECLRHHGRTLFTVPTMWSGAYPVSGNQAICA